MTSQETIVDASISTLAAALRSGRLTSVDLVAKYLRRISTYDCRNTSLNAIPLLNENVFEEAAAADDRRIAGEPCGALDGLPFTVKDSYKVKGMTVASGSEAFETLIANEDAFTVKALRDAGAILLGKTNMCPMAYGGMIRGVYGRAESPYNAEYLPAAFGSGSSNGSGVSVAASFAAFGMGEETVSSGRSPASNNALVAYTPSRGLISIRGNWPLYPTCDVVVPHTRTVNDAFALLDVITAQDSTTAGDFWRDQPFIQIPSPWSNSPTPFAVHKDEDYLKGKRIGIPQNFIKQDKEGPYVSADVEKLWHQTRSALEAAGAIIEVIPELPVLHAYQNSIKNQNALTNGNVSQSSPQLPPDWNSTERGPLIAHAWQDFLHHNADPSYSSLANIDPVKIFPHLPRSDPQVKFTEPANAIKWSQLASYITKHSTNSHGQNPIYSIPQLSNAVKALESMRKAYFETWLDESNLDFVAFPAAGDVAKSDADINFDSAKHAWTDGVVYSHGNRALRHLGIPSVTVPMGMLEQSQMPMGLTIIGRAYDDLNILKFSWAFENKTRSREVPIRTPALDSDVIPHEVIIPGHRPVLEISKCVAEAKSAIETTVRVEGVVRLVPDKDKVARHPDPVLEVSIDGNKVPSSDIQLKRSGDAPEKFNFACECVTASPPIQDRRNAVIGKIARDSTMVMVLARHGKGERPSGFLKLIHASNQ